MQFLRRNARKEEVCSKTELGIYQRREQRGGHGRHLDSGVGRRASFFSVFIAFSENIFSTSFPGYSAHMRNAGCSTSSFANNDDERWNWKKKVGMKDDSEFCRLFMSSSSLQLFSSCDLREFEVLASSSILAVGSATETENSATFFTITARSRRMLECVSRWKIPFFRFSTMHFNITTPCLTVPPLANLSQFEERAETLQYDWKSHSYVS